VTRAVLAALDASWESALVAAVEGTAGYTVARRCADLADLLAAAAAGHGDIALVSADLRALDRPALHELASHGVEAAGVVGPDDEPGERRLRQLGLDVILRADLHSHEIDDALDSLESSRRAAAGHTPEPTGGGPPEEDAPVQPPGTVIAVWGPTGAPGRTTVALNLAAELALREPTLLVDLDTYGSSIAQALGLLDEAPGVAAAARLADQGGLDLPGLARVAPEVSSGLRVLTGLPRPQRWTELRAPSVAHVLATARALVRFVVIDCGFSVEDDEELSYDTLAPRRNAATLTALEVADELVVVGTADPIGLQRLVRAVQDLASVPSPTARVVVNRVRGTSVGPRPEQRITEALGRFAGLADLVFLPFDPATLDGAVFAGTTLVEFAPQSDLRGAVASLADAYAAAPVTSRRGRRSRVRS
jgi:MinD-like ATPase involved in chromosome partitioning or flagellar assembly